MKLSVFAPIFSHFMGPLLPLEDMLDAVAATGADAVEFGGGPFNGELYYFKPDDLLGSGRALSRFTDAVASRDLTISGLACHGNPLHPDPLFAEASQSAYSTTLQLAEKLGVRVVTLFSGCPGDVGGARYPNWVTSLYPPEMEALLRWQWEEAVIPYWSEAGPAAVDHGVQLAFELHPGMVVYNPATLMRLRDAVGPVIGATIDVAHLFEQMIDPVVAVRELGEAVASVHAKDTSVNAEALSRHGVFAPPSLADREGDQNPYAHARDAPFSTCTLGYGHDVHWWKSFVGALRVAGYDHALMIEQYDALVSIPEGLSKAVAVLREAVFKDPGLATRPAGSTWVDGAWRFSLNGGTT